MIERTLSQIIKSKFHKGKAIILTGPRQTGKTTLLLQLLEKEDSHLFLDGDDPTVRQLLTRPNTEQIRSIIGKNTLVFLDEGQRIPDIGITLKIITDQFKKVQLLVSGSSSLDIANSINESLTGRKWEYLLYPISWKEWEQDRGYLKALQSLEDRLIYGMYPEILNAPGDEKEKLKNLASSYLYKDLLSYSNIKKPDVLEQLLQALAFQLGSEVSQNELARLLKIDKNTVRSYLDLLEKSYVIFSLPSFSRNLRNEIQHSRKVYFYDNGIRNFLIGNFSPLTMRTDKGALWENFMISERRKANEYSRRYCRSFFWRTTAQQEIDYIEDADGAISAWEFKWASDEKIKKTKTFSETYKIEPLVVHSKNFREFLIDDHQT